MKKLFALIFLACFSAQAATWYVDARSTGPYYGTNWATAWTNTGYADWTKITAGDTIYISGGSNGLYYAAIGFAKSGTATAPITIKHSEEAGHNGNVLCGYMSSVSKDYVVFDGSRSNILAPDSVYDMWQITNNIGIICSNLTTYNFQTARFLGVKILWCELGPCSSTLPGIYLNNLTAIGGGSRIYGCYLHHTGDDNINNNGGAVGDWDAIEIDHNVIVKAADDGIQMGTSGFTIHHNIIGDKRQDLTAGHPDTLQLTFVSSGKLKVYNNVLRNPKNSWFYTTLGANPAGYAGDVYFYGNVVYQDRDWPYVTFANYGFHLAAWGNTIPVASTVWSNVYILNNDFYYCMGEGVRPAFNSDDKAGHELWAMVATNMVVANNAVIDVSYNYASPALIVESPGWILPSATNGVLYTTNEVQVLNNVVAGANKKIRYGGTDYTTGESMLAPLGWYNYSSYPTFVSTNTYDFRLQPTDTVARDKGTNLSYLITQKGLTDLNKDLYGNVRGYNGYWDIGAIEYVPEGTTPTGDTNLLVWYKFQENFTNNGYIQDYSGYTNNGLRFGYCGYQTNFPSAVSVTNGTATSIGAQFRYYWDGYGDYGRSGDYFGITNLNKGNVSELTVCLWAKYDAAYDGNGDPGSYILDHNATLIDTGTYQTAGSWRLGRENFWSGATAINRTKWEVFTNTTTSRLQMSFGDAGDSNGATPAMKHYAVVFNRGTNTIYANGVKVSEAIIPQTTLQLNSQSKWIGVGAWPHHGSTTRDPWLFSSDCASYDQYPNTFWFNGKMDDLRIYDRALSAQEIAAIASVQINNPAAIISYNMPVSSTEQLSSTWTITTTGNNPIEYYLKKAGSVVASATNSLNVWNYTLYNLTTNDSGSYQLAVTNAYGGNVTPSVTFTVSALPVGVVISTNTLKGLSGNLRGDASYLRGTL